MWCCLCACVYVCEDHRVLTQACLWWMVQGGLQGMLRVLQGQFLRDILAPAGVVYDEVLKKSRWAALEGASFRSRKKKSLNPGSFRCVHVCLHASVCRRICLRSCTCSSVCAHMCVRGGDRRGACQGSRLQLVCCPHGHVHVHQPCGRVGGQCCGTP